MVTSVITRQIGESVIIGNDITITVINITGDRVRFSVDAPKDTPAYRGEVYQCIQKEKMKESREDLKK